MFCPSSQLLSRPGSSLAEPRRKSRQLEELASWLLSNSCNCSIAFIWSDANSHHNIYEWIHFRIIIMSIPDKNWQPPTVTLDTSMGEVVVELYWKQAPLTCRNFAELARRGYYNDTKFHRIIKVGFVFFRDLCQIISCCHYILIVKYSRWFG